MIRRILVLLLLALLFSCEGDPDEIKTEELYGTWIPSAYEIVMLDESAKKRGLYWQFYSNEGSSVYAYILEPGGTGYHISQYGSGDDMTDTFALKWTHEDRILDIRWGIEYPDTLILLADLSYRIVFLSENQLHLKWNYLFPSPYYFESKHIYYKNED